jgi:hypothetical protein
MENNKNSKNILFLLCLVGALLVGFFIGHYYKGAQDQNISVISNMSNGSNSTIVSNQVNSSNSTNSNSTNENSEWVCTSGVNTNDCDVYYNPSRISSTQDGNVRVWVEFTGEDSKYRAIKLGSIEGISAERYKNWSSNVILFELNCDNQTIRVVSYRSYDIDGNVIYSDDTIDPFTPIVPDSVGEDIYRLVCKNHIQGG